MGLSIFFYNKNGPMTLNFEFTSFFLTAEPAISFVNIRESTVKFYSYACQVSIGQKMCYLARSPTENASIWERDILSLGRTL